MHYLFIFYEQMLKKYNFTLLITVMLLFLKLRSIFKLEMDPLEMYL